MERLKDHLMKCHFHCLDCSITLKNEEELLAHYTDQDHVQSMQCSKCSFFTTKDSFQMDNHCKETHLYCIKCDVQFKSAMSLVDHLYFCDKFEVSLEDAALIEKMKSKANVKIQINAVQPLEKEGKFTPIVEAQSHRIAPRYVE